jgi:two-component system response regulator PilR (NtrC family)
MTRLVGEDPAFREAIETAQRAARSTSPVLIVGESGTGKELFARLIHEASPRATGPFVPVNCSAIPGELVESMLFGHEKGAFTGASEKRLGLFEQADGGTLFLDEIGELALAHQPRLLRALETRKVRRVGGTQERTVDVRVLGATHVDVRRAVAAGRMRLDLYHRLAVFELHVPPLRQRLGDLPLLVKRFLVEISAEYGARRVSAQTLEELRRYTWPGNVRELRNAVHRAAALSPDGELRMADLMPATATGLSGWREERRLVPPTRVRGERLTALESLGVDEVMYALVEAALQKHGSLRRAAAHLKISKSTLHEWVRRYGVDYGEDDD